MLHVADISFSFKGKPVILNVSFDLHPGIQLAIIGESGSGKSTLLKLLYGMYDLDAGQITYKQIPILGPKYNLLPGNSVFQYLAQDFGLMPFTTVAENVGQYLSNTNKQIKAKRVEELLAVVDMTDFAHVFVKELSGGQQQRVALAKALAPLPEVLLLDEPFSHIDVFRSNSLRRQLYHYLKVNHITCITATHNSDDVLSFADEVLVLQQGGVVAAGNTKELYHAPGSKYVASLFSDVNEIPLCLLTPDANKSEIVLVYPSMLEVSKTGLEVAVINSYYKGLHYLIEAKYSQGTVFFEHPDFLQQGTIVAIRLGKIFAATSRH